MGSGSVALGSDLLRKKWLQEGLAQRASLSFWSAYTGMSSNSIVYQTNNENASDGHTVVFDYSGKLSGRAVKGKDTAYGKGEIKRKFSTKLTVERYRIPVDNGDNFDGVDIGDLNINQHTDSRSKLADLMIRWKDQMIFDALQGSTSTAPSHIYELTAATFGYTDLLAIEAALKSGTGFVAPSATGAPNTGTAAMKRAPLEPYQLQTGESVWLFLVDSYMAQLLKQDAKYQTLVINGDVRGAQNRAFTGVIGRIGQLIIVEASNFFGYTAGTGAFSLDATEVEISGLRQYTTTLANGTVLNAWSGQTTFDTDALTASKIVSRGLILGQGACQVAFGKMPDYKFQASTDFGITSQSAVEFWTNAGKTNLKLEGGAVYKQAQIIGLDFGVIAVDIAHA
ncbi:MAG: DUF4043 family protein [Ignisphaera sp.]|nr:DUF4043 family protein [Ignisphaera sp.]